MKRTLLGLFSALLALLLIAYFFRTTIALRMMERVVATNLGSDWVSELPDGLHLVLCGAGSPLPDPKRSGPCVAVIAGQQVFVVDAGSGASRRLRIASIRPCGKRRSLSRRDPAHSLSLGSHRRTR